MTLKLSKLDELAEIVGELKTFQTSFPWFLSNPILSHEVGLLFLVPAYVMLLNYCGDLTARIKHMPHIYTNYGPL